MILEEKKEKIKKIALENLNFGGGYIYCGIESGFFNEVISKLNDNQTKTKLGSLFKGETLSAEKQFYDVLSNFFHFIEYHLAPLERRDMPLLMTIDSTTPKFLLSNKYYGDNVEYYQKEFKYTLIDNMYKNICYIYDEHRDFFEKLEITKNMELNDENIDKLFKFLKELIWCNQGNYHCYYIFENHEVYDEIPKKVSDKERELLKHGQYCIQWDFLIDRYKEKSKYAKEILKY